MIFTYLLVLDLTHTSHCAEGGHATEVIPKLKRVHVKPILCFLFHGSSAGALG